MTSADNATLEAVQRFLIEEARLLDGNEWDQWLALFTDEGVYWMPASPEQTDPLNHVSLIYDDALMRQMRCKRFSDRNEVGSLSLQPAPRCMRMLTNFQIDATTNGITASANLMFAQYAHKAVSTYYARVRWELSKKDAGYLINRKRVDLLNSDGPLTDILAYF